MALAQRTERRGRRDFPEKPVVGGAARARPYQDVDLADLGIAVEQQGERDLAHEAGHAGDEQLATAEGLGEIDRPLQRLHDYGSSFFCAAIPG